MERRDDGVLVIRRETWELCRKYPEYRVVDDSEVLACHSRGNAGTEFRPRGHLDAIWGQPLSGADLLLLFPDKTWKRAATDEQGEAAADLHTTHLSMTVFCAAPGYAAHLERQ